LRHHISANRRPLPGAKALPHAHLAPRLGRTHETLISRVTPSDWSLLRELRLRALHSDPLSFGSTFEREAGFADEVWQEWAGEDAAGVVTATFLAKRGEQAVGMVGAYRDEDDDGLFHVIAMWVAPEARRQGVGRTLLSQAEEWIRLCRGRIVRLHMTTAATDARRLYEAAGFKLDGEQRASSHTAGLTELSLRKVLE
jgi:ribosomal protein S18 acetylase RimI-like enzyme